MGLAANGKSRHGWRAASQAGEHRAKGVTLSEAMDLCGNTMLKPHRRCNVPDAWHRPVPGVACLQTAGLFRVETVQFSQRNYRANILGIPEFPRTGHVQLLVGMFEDGTIKLFAIAPDFDAVAAVDVDKPAEAGQHPLEAVAAGKRQFACFIRLSGPPGDGIQADGAPRLCLLAADGGFELGAQLTGTWIKEYPGDDQNNGTRFDIQRFNIQHQMMHWQIPRLITCHYGTTSAG